MKTEWDYTDLADAYLKRPPYAKEALEKIFKTGELQKGSHVCDVGAGVGHLTIPLVEKGYIVTAIEPNDAMRTNGIKQTAKYKNVKWIEAGGEDTGQPSASFDFVSFGSSFNVMNRQKALMETSRILKPGKYFVCMWNHRDLDDFIQKRIESIICECIPGYSYGTRREDQSDEIMRSELFEDLTYIEGKYVYEQPVEECINAWASHATLQRQAGENFSLIISAIRDYLLSLKKPFLLIPYVTRAWMARSKG